MADLKYKEKGIPKSLFAKPPKFKLGDMVYAHGRWGRGIVSNIWECRDFYEDVYPNTSQYDINNFCKENLGKDYIYEVVKEEDYKNGKRDYNGYSRIGYFYEHNLSPKGVNESMSFKKFLSEKEKYDYTGHEKDLFDFKNEEGHPQPKFKIGDRIKIINGIGRTGKILEGIRWNKNENNWYYKVKKENKQQGESEEFGKYEFNLILAKVNEDKK
jgi:hypothetical protein